MSDSAVVYSLFVVVPICCCDFVLGPCFVLCFFVSFLLVRKLSNHLATEEKDDCFTLIVLWLSHCRRQEAL